MAAPAANARNPRGPDTISSLRTRVLRKHATLAAAEAHALEVYLRSLEHREKELELLVRLLSIESAKGDTTSNLQDALLDAQLYADAFWPLVYSLYDIYANALNVVHRAVNGEDQVTFQRACINYQHQARAVRTGTQIPQAVTDKMCAIRDSGEFERLSAFRHLSTHRRFVGLLKRRIEGTPTAPYANTTGLSPGTVQYDVVICDDPSTLDPTFESQQRLTTEVNSTLNAVRTHIIQLLRLL